MDVRDELLTIAEIGVGIAGFSGVIAVFLQSGGLASVDRMRFVNLFTAAFSTIFLAFIPIALLHYGLEGERLWRASSLGMVVLWCVNVGVGLRVFPRLFTDLPGSTAGPITMIALPSLLNLAAQVLNLGGWWWQPGFLAYLFGLFVYIYAAGVMFVYIILYRPEA